MRNEAIHREFAMMTLILQQVLPDWQKAVMKNKKAARLGCFF